MPFVLCKQFQNQPYWEFRLNNIPHGKFYILFPPIVSFTRKVIHVRKIPLIVNNHFGRNDGPLTANIFTYFYLANESKRRKMSKTLKKDQSDILLNKMLENPDIAKGFTKENREKVAEFWKKLTLELNSAGPPVKSEFEWKKVWTDQKRYVRKKAAANKVHQKGTGGGPNKTQKFSPSEETIFQLVGMKEAVEGVGSSMSFGLARKDTQSEINATLDLNDAQYIEAADDFPFATELIEEDISVPPTPTISHATRKRKMNTNDVIVEELETQKNLCDKVTEGVSVMRDHNTEVQSGIKKIYRSLDRLGDINKELLKEQHRHNTEMENIRKSELKNKIEKGQRMLELEEQKIEIMRKREYNEPVF